MLNLTEQRRCLAVRCWLLNVINNTNSNFPSSEFCGKLFSCMNNLRTHLYYHSDPKFVCEFDGCGKKFFMRKLLKAHMNVGFSIFVIQSYFDSFSYLGSSRSEGLRLLLLRQKLFLPISSETAHHLDTYEAQNRLWSCRLFIEFR